MSGRKRFREVPQRSLAPFVVRTNETVHIGTGRAVLVFERPAIRQKVRPRFTDGDFQNLRHHKHEHRTGVEVRDSGPNRRKLQLRLVVQVLDEGGEDDGTDDGAPYQHLRMDGVFGEGAR